MLTVARKPAARPARLGRCPQRAESPPGFTLMELLVSFSLIGLVAVFIHLGYSIGLSAREKAEASLEAYQAAQASLDVLSRQIASMVPYVSSQEHEERPVPVLLFRASPQSLGFVTTWSAASGFAGGLRFVQYFAAAADADPDPSADPDADSSANPAPAGRRLLLNERPLPPEAGLRGPVIRGVSSKPRTTASWPSWPRRGPAPAPSPWPRAWLRWPSGGWPGRKRRAFRSAPGSIRAVSGAAPGGPSGPNCRPVSSSACAGTARGPGARRTLSWPCPSGATEGQGCVFKLS